VEEKEDESEKERNHWETLRMIAACGCATMEPRAGPRTDGD
jgi:hypothetical protein